MRLKSTCVCVYVCVLCISTSVWVLGTSKGLSESAFSCMFLQDLDEKGTKDEAKISIFVAYSQTLIDTKWLVKQAPFKTNENTSSDTETLKNW